MRSAWNDKGKDIHEERHDRKEEEEQEDEDKQDE